MIDKNRFLDDIGRPLTQSLFLEINYDEKYAVYTLKEFDYEYNGRMYPSLKRLYLETMDPKEYLFATKHLYSWEQWQRICKNKVLAKEIDKWRYELDLKMSSLGVREMVSLMNSENGSFQAAKYLADKGWDKRGAGRPSKEEIDRHLAVEDAIDKEFSADIKRLEDFRKN